MFKKIIIVLGILLIVLIGAIASTPLWLNLETVKEKIIAEAEKATGRDFNIAGELTLEFYPYIGFSAQEVSLANAPQFTDISKDMLSIDRLGIAVEVLPLFVGSVKLDHLMIENPTISLAQSTDGENNWTFSSPSTEPKAASKTTKNPDKSATSSLPAKVALKDIRVVNGSLAYHTNGQTQTFNNIHADINLPALDKPLHLKSRLHYNDKPVSADITLNSLEKLMAHEDVGLSLKTSFDQQQLDTSGNVSLSRNAVFSYDLKNIDIRTQTLRLSGDSQGAVQTKSSPLSADVNLHITSAEFTLPKEPRSNSEETKVELSNTALQNSEADKPTKIVWPDDKLPLDGLTAANVKANITFDTMTIDGITARNGDMNLNLKDGKLLANLKSLEAFDGAMEAVIEANQQGHFGLDVNLTDLSISALNKELGQELPIAGTINVAATYKADGQSITALIENLDGTFNVELLGAGLSGTDAKTMLTTYGGPFGMAILQTVDPQALSRLNDRVSSVIVKSETFSGIMDLTSVQVLTPIAEVTGEGNIHLPNSTINLYMTPRMLMDVATHSKSLDAVVANLRTPFYVRGDLLAPKVQLDQEALGKNLMRESIKSGLDKAIRDLDGNDNPLVRDGLNVLRGFFGEKEAK